MFRLFIAAFLLTLLTACAEPLVWFPGGHLSGEPEAPPQTWNVPDTVQVEFRAQDPYSINIWAVALNGELFITTGVDGSRWSSILDGGDTGVRVRIDRSLYDLQARRVTDADLRKRVVEAYVEKYGVDQDDDWMVSGPMYGLGDR
ncbi:MAG: hypothetical protein O3A63_10990 [Proteobacteria bacterium]|nr:hypothetical protein [Pseudomonadota bacterium]